MLSVRALGIWLIFLMASSQKPWSHSQRQESGFPTVISGFSVIGGGALSSITPYLSRWPQAERDQALSFLFLLPEIVLEVGTVLT